MLFMENRNPHIGDRHEPAIAAREQLSGGQIGNAMCVTGHLAVSKNTIGNGKPLTCRNGLDGADQYVALTIYLLFHLIPFNLNIFSHAPPTGSAGMACGTYSRG